MVPPCLAHVFTFASAFGIVFQWHVRFLSLYNMGWNQGRGGLLRDPPVVCSMVDGGLQKSQLVKQSDRSLSSQALRPQIGHVFVGVGASVGFGHL